MSKSVYKLFLQTNKNMQQYLINELVANNIKCKNKPSLNGVIVQCDFPTIFKILHQIKTVESIKISIGNEIQARNEKELENNLKKLPFHAHLPTNLEDFQFQGITTKSFRSNLFHEKLVSNIVQKHINLMPIRKQHAEIKKLGYADMSITSIKSEKKHREKLIKHLKDKLLLPVQQKKLTNANNNNNDSDIVLSKEENKFIQEYKERPLIPQITL